jgi:predicted metal-dependent phosphoesterase TrpH
MSTFIYNSQPLHRLFISLRNHRVMRCDLHVHSAASGMLGAPVLNKFCRESYNDAAEVYDRLKALGMGAVTVTDHDSIDAAEILRKNPDFFLSEEVTVAMPTGTQVHLGVYDIRERDHLEIQRRRDDFLSLVMYLSERKLFFSVNHVFSGLTGPRDERDFDWFASYAPAMETRNGQMCANANYHAVELATRFGKVPIAGSDSHTLAGLGLTYTEVTGARTVDEFFAGLMQGHGCIHGVHGGYTKLTADVFSVVRSLVHEKPWTLAISPLAALVPLFTAVHWLNEIRFCKKWSALLQRCEKQPRLLWDISSRERDLFSEQLSPEVLDAAFADAMELGLELSTST